ncbi:pyridoxal phosphate-dependent transferase [Zychaea mexicana]|uniref:pyridoxal phosphate-dependent transferase n=1 Tax=Zychaea mexicana TaxID=64656 RepID=UPI0022FE9B5C|nr:pyridoxal phosphate-dependent transferase [Zychaea mexicana]KAI9480238.1 pyridoxal phosphate-dependent transferase [Zychaea mexicana]
MDYRKFLSTRSKARVPSAIRALMPLYNKKDMISLAAGMPNPETFPYASMSVTLKSGEIITFDDDLFRRSLSYDYTSGMPQFNQWLRELQIREHAPPCKEFDLSIGSGSQDLFTKAMEMFAEPGTALLVEEPTYAGALSFLKSEPVDLVPVNTDSEGIDPEMLDRILTSWPELNPTGKKDQPRPQVLYTVPVGGNPTGVSSTLQRKKRTYEVCQKHDILIIEDDPYYYLQFKTPRTPSYFSMDVDGRVLRMDSMSKILSSGIRIGWVTGPKVLVERINLHTMSTNLQPAGVPQLMAYGLLAEWGYDGFFAHVDRVANFYRERRDVFEESLERHLKGLAEWVVPDSGMFVWIRLLGGITDSNELILQKAVKNNVLAVPGVAFMPLNDITPCVRVSYSCIEKDQIDEAVRRLATVIREEAAANSANN